MSEGPKIEFRAIIPPFKSSLTLGGDTPCVKFEAPMSERANFVGLAALQGVTLKVTVEVDDADKAGKCKDEGKSGEPPQNFRF